MLYGSFGLVVTSLAPIASLVIADLNMSHGEMGLAMGAWQLVYIFSAIPSGILLDRIGPRYMLTLGGFLVGLSALARVFADDAETLILAVMLFGLGGPIISAGAPKVVVSSFTGSSRRLAMGIYMTGPAIAASSPWLPPTPFSCHCLTNPGVRCSGFGQAFPFLPHSAGSALRQ